MTFDCTECKIFLRCEKNSDEWAKAKKLYPNDEKRQIAHINHVALQCDPKLVKAKMED